MLKYRMDLCMILKINRLSKLIEQSIQNYIDYTFFLLINNKRFFTKKKNYKQNKNNQISKFLINKLKIIFFFLYQYFH